MSELAFHSSPRNKAFADAWIGLYAIIANGLCMKMDKTETLILPLSECKFLVGIVRLSN